MGHKSTVHLKRSEAIEKLVTLLEEKKRAKLRAKLFVKAEAMTNTELEDRLEEENDAAYATQYGDGNTGFDNYIVVQDEWWDEEEHGRKW